MNMNYDFDKCAFHVSAVRTPEALYGWAEGKGLLHSVIQSIVNGESCIIHGERRSGKTSILKCVEYVLLNRYLDGPVPVNVDFPSIGFKPLGFDAGMVKILSFISKSFKNARAKGRDWIPSPFLLPSIEGDFLQFTESSIRASYTAENVLEELDTFLKAHKKSAVLIFDEYEYLENVFYDTQESFFYPIRSRQDDYDPSEGGICCIIAGAERPKGRAQHGSPQFNLFKHPIPVPPLEKAPFAKMWNDLYGECSIGIQEKIDSHGYSIDQIYEMCGGRPGFAKRLVEMWVSSPDEDAPLDDWFKNIFWRQPEAARQILIDLTNDAPVDSYDDNVERLKLLYLIEDDPDPELGGMRIKGSLWADFLRRESQKISAMQKPEPRTFSNAGELGKAILSGGLLEKLLKNRKGEGEKGDWLEFKACLRPSAEQKAKDEQKKDVNYNYDDYVWNVLKAIIAMRNTRGGLVCIGAGDDAELIGVEVPENVGDEDFRRRKILAPLKKKLTLGSGKKIELDNFVLDDLASSGEIIIEKKVVSGVTIVAIVVYPISDISIDTAVTVSDGDSEYMLIRRPSATNDKLIRHRDRKAFLAKYPLPCSDLDEFWLELIR